MLLDSQEAAAADDAGVDAHPDAGRRVELRAAEVEQPEVAVAVLADLDRLAHAESLHRRGQHAEVDGDGARGDEREAARGGGDLGGQPPHQQPGQPQRVGPRGLQPDAALGVQAVAIGNEDELPAQAHPVLGQEQREDRPGDVTGDADLEGLQAGPQRPPVGGHLRVEHRSGQLDPEAVGLAEGEALRERRAEGERRGAVGDRDRLAPAGDRDPEGLLERVEVDRDEGRQLEGSGHRLRPQHHGGEARRVAVAGVVPQHLEGEDVRHVVGVGRQPQRDPLQDHVGVRHLRLDLGGDLVEVRDRDGDHRRGARSGEDPADGDVEVPAQRLEASPDVAGGRVQHVGDHREHRHLRPDEVQRLGERPAGRRPRPQCFLDGLGEQRLDGRPRVGQARQVDVRHRGGVAEPARDPEQLLHRRDQREQVGLGPAELGDQGRHGVLQGLQVAAPRGDVRRHRLQVGTLQAEVGQRPSYDVGRGELRDQLVEDPGEEGGDRAVERRGRGVSHRGPPRLPAG